MHLFMQVALLHVLYRIGDYTVVRYRCALAQLFVGSVITCIMHLVTTYVTITVITNE